MRLKVLLTALGSVIFCAHLNAQCANMIFSCITTNNKVVEVCDSGSKIDYSFGKKGQKSEMALSIPRPAASTYQWDGMTTGIHFAVRIPNGNTIYEVYSNTGRNIPGKDAGINVYIDKKNVASIDCKIDTLIDGLDGVDLPRGPLMLEDS